MKQIRYCIVVGLLLSVSGAALASVRPSTAPSNEMPVVPEESAGVFVGVREFPYDATLAKVAYAVDDAVDLAWSMSMDPQTRLVKPERVILALSGEPQKIASRERLRELMGARAKRQSAAQSDIIRALRDQARIVGANGILIVAFATHGVNEKGRQLLLTESSILRNQDETSLPETTIRDIVTEAGTARALILVDACRQRLISNDTRANDPSRRSVAALLEKMGQVQGQVVLSAAAPGQYAYDDDLHQNGVFTAAIMDGLHCKAPTDEHGFVTADTLAFYVEQRVLAWVQKHRDPRARIATQIQFEGQAKDLPLSVCPSRNISQ